MMGSAVVTGYRIYFNTRYKCLTSIFMLHNETVNIWTHLFGFLAFLALAVCSIHMLFDNNLTPMPVWPLLMHAIGGAFMLGASATYHTLNCCSKSDNEKGQSCDYAGIAVMIAASATPPFYYGFKCPEV